MVGGGGCIARADVHDDGPAADTAAVRRQIATKVNAACNPRIIAAIAFVGHERSERPSDTRAVLFAHRRRAARDETSSSNDRRPSGRGGSPCEDAGLSSRFTVLPFATRADAHTTLARMLRVALLGWHISSLCCPRKEVPSRQRITTGGPRAPDTQGTHRGTRSR